MKDEQYERAQEIKRDIRDLKCMIKDIDDSIEKDTRGIEIHSMGCGSPVPKHIYPIIKSSIQIKINELEDEYSKL